MLKVEKYVHGCLEEVFTVPLGLVRLLKGVLPRSAIDALEKGGIDLEGIVCSGKRNEFYQHMVMCEEKGVMKRIVLTLMV